MNLSLFKTVAMFSKSQRNRDYGKCLSTPHWIWLMLGYGFICLANPAYALGQYNLSIDPAVTQSSSPLAPSSLANYSSNTEKHQQPDGRVDLSNYFEYLSEDAIELQLDDIRRGSNRSRWHSTSPHGLSFGWINKAVWLRTRIYNPHHTQQRRIMEISLPFLESIDVYLERNASDYSYDAGHGVNQNELAGIEELLSAQRGLQLPINLAPKEELTVYFRVKPLAALNFSVLLWDAETFRETNNTERAAKSFALGLILTVFFFCLVRFKQRQDSALGYLLGYLVALTVSLVTLSGIVSSLFFPGNILLENKILVWSLFAFAVFGVLFSRAFFQLQQAQSKIYQVLMLFSGVSLFGMMSSLILSAGIGIAIMLFAQLGICFTVVALSVQALLNKTPAALLFTVAWGIMLCAVLLLGVALTLGLDPAWPIEGLSYFAATVQALLFGLAGIEREQALYKRRHKRHLDALMSARLSNQRHCEALESERQARILEQAELENQINTNEALERRVLQLSRELNKSYRELQRIGDMDLVTGLRNRNFCLCNIADSIDGYICEKRVFSLLLVNFELPLTSDELFSADSLEECLRGVGHTLRRLLPHVKETDFSHMGGERFAVLLHGVDCRQINTIASQLFEDLNALEFVLAGKYQKFAIAVGGVCAASCVTPTPESLLQAAERALKASKHQGVYQVCAEIADPR